MAHQQATFRANAIWLVGATRSRIVVDPMPSLFIPSHSVCCSFRCIALGMGVPDAARGISHYVTGRLSLCVQRSLHFVQRIPHLSFATDTADTGLWQLVDHCTMADYASTRPDSPEDRYAYNAPTRPGMSRSNSMTSFLSLDRYGEDWGTSAMTLFGELQLMHSLPLLACIAECKLMGRCRGNFLWSVSAPVKKSMLCPCMAY